MAGPTLREEENRFLNDLNVLKNSIGSDYPAWESEISELLLKAQTIFSSSNYTKEKYAVVREAESLYGGMGSLNDGPFSNENEKRIQNLHDSIEILLRFYWKDLGHKYHSENFDLIPLSSIVQLIPGKIRYFDRNEKPSIVQEDEHSKKKWTVVRFDGPDISNMPTYLIKSIDETYMVVRHEALKIIELANEATAEENPLKTVINSKKPSQKNPGLLLIVISVIISSWFFRVILEKLETNKKLPSIQTPSNFPKK